jgi:hypothetical protein
LCQLAKQTRPFILNRIFRKKIFRILLFRTRNISYTIFMFLSTRIHSAQ